ncbi:NAD/NADP-dependent octopine/nopaline dehydrogenase family protein [Proteiniborus ethanoligenes]|uniref:NAD/NADP-dependent octopine/nopaline dehydrogenase family protein n=1 Tax=Proteiniborus ethanoligenes TaxID=415015 RepID=UPI00244E7251|nr:NAD/NADP-dependent octopine/nopaline dehydrogenase family protein [Proteiniborus ethanoligenes]
MIVLTKKLTYCVIGAGNGGIAMAGYLAMLGYKVNLYNRTLEKLIPLMKDPVIYLTGEENGYGVLNKVTNSMEEAIDDVDIIMVTIPAIGHYNIAKEMAPYIKNDQIIILNPGRTGGALEVYETLLRERNKNNIIVAEAQTFIYASRATSYNSAHIFKSKREVTLAAIPATKTNYVLELINEAYPQFIPAKDVLETSINNYGAIFHPAPTLLNSGHIERCAPFEYYTEGITPSIGNFLEKIDRERMELGRILQVETLSAAEWLKETYGSKGDNIYEAVQNNSGYKGLQAPQGLQIRYIYEDVPYGLVPMESMAHSLGMKTPAITSIINIAQFMTNRDFRKEGRTADRLGLDGLSITEMHMLARGGTIVKRRLEEVV